MDRVVAFPGRPPAPWVPPMTVRRHGVLASVLVAAAFAAATVGGSIASAADPSPSPTASSPAPSPSTSTAPEPFPMAVTGCASLVLDAMSLEERVGQLFLLGIGADLDASERTLIERRHLGAVTFAAFVNEGTAGIRMITDAVQALATSETPHHVGFLIAANQEGGRVQALSGTGFSTIPTALAQGRLAPDQLRLDVKGWGLQLAEAGVNLDLAPVADVVPTNWVARNAPIGQLKRAFDHTPEVVETHVRAFIEGMHKARVLTTVKHFPGLGRVRGNTDFAASVHDRTTTADSPSLRPFQVAVEAGVPFVMTSLASYAHLDGRTLAAFSRPITTGLLRDTMGFEGVIVSDDLSVVAVRDVPAGERALRFLQAGGDLIIVTVMRDARAMATAIVDEATASESLRTLVDTSALRVLEAKESAGLLACDA
jgi:beta-N-acetylhexosaminidase